MEKSMDFIINGNHIVPDSYLREWKMYLTDTVKMSIEKVEVTPIDEEFKIVDFKIYIENNQVMNIKGYMTWGDAKLHQFEKVTSLLSSYAN
jgi:hypothetical protein